MKHLNKIASVFCVAAMALTALTGCEGSDMFSVNSPDWISEKIDSINAAKGNDNALPEGEEDVYTVGVLLTILLVSGQPSLSIMSYLRARPGMPCSI